MFVTRPTDWASAAHSIQVTRSFDQKRCGCIDITESLVDSLSPLQPPTYVSADIHRWRCQMFNKPFNNANIQSPDSNKSPPESNRQEMIDDTFVDFYELLNIDCDTTDDVVEQRFREFAQQPHPGPDDAEKIEIFSQSMEAYETLTDPELRAAYDIVYEGQENEKLELLQDTSCIEDDSAQRHRLLSFFYAKRRQSMEAPGIGGETLFELAKIPKNVLNFHLWYFKENGWLKREENGMLAITAHGVDKIESRVEHHTVDTLATKNASSVGDEPSPARDKALETETETVGTEDPS